MVNQLANFVGNQLQPKHNQNNAQQAKVAPSVKPSKVEVVGNPNPFNGNPFVATKTASTNFGKNMPVQGGFFAGYHNGQPNIVGAKLFVEA